RRVVDADGLAIVVADVRVHPADTKLGVAVDDAEADLRAGVRCGDLQPERECTLDQVAGHVRWPPHLIAPASPAAASVPRSTAAPHRQDCLPWPCPLPTLNVRCCSCPSWGCRPCRCASSWRSRARRTPLCASC